MKNTSKNQYLNPLFYVKGIASYLANHLTEPKSAVDAQAKVIISLNVAGKLALFIGLFTSWAFIIPTVFQITEPIFSFNSSLISALVSCAVYSCFIDLPLGVAVPHLYYQLFKIRDVEDWKEFTGLIFRTSPTAIFVIGAVYFSMFFSWQGNTYTTAWLLEHKDPRHSASIITVLDSTKHATERSIRENEEDVLADAKALDKSKFDKARGIMKAARHEAARKYPLHERNNWQKERHDRIISKARQDSSDVVFNVMNYEVALRKLEDKVYQSNRHHDAEIQAEKEKMQTKIDKFEAQLSTYRIILRDVGYYATPAFLFIFGVVIVITLPSRKSKKKKAAKVKADDDDVEEAEAEEEDPLETVKEIRRHLSQDINRINDAIRDGKDTSTYAKNIIEKCSNMKSIDLPYYENLVKEYQKFYTNKFGEDAVYDDTTAMFYI
jgi:hypothetical protein